VSLKSLSSKLYFAIAALALVLWMFGVSGGTILTVVLVASMLAMHAGGHGGHGSSTPHAGAGAEAGTHHPAHGFRGDATLEASPQTAPDRAAPPKPKSGCH